MFIRMTCRFTPEQFASRGFEIEMSPEDIGLTQPTNLVEFKDVLKQLQLQGAKAVHLFLFKEGNEDKDKVIATLKVYQANEN